MLVLKGLILYNLGYIAYQDLKSREVYWFLFPSLIILMGLLHYLQVSPIHYINAILLNLAIIFIIMTLQYLYTIVKIKRPFFKEVFGLGDALFFVAVAIAFPTITFSILFAFSLFFSLSIWLIFKNKSLHQNPPLAGYMAIFLLLIFTGNWITNTINLYLI